MVGGPAGAPSVPVPRPRMSSSARSLVEALGTRDAASDVSAGVPDELGGASSSLGGGVGMGRRTAGGGVGSERFAVRAAAGGLGDSTLALLGRGSGGFAVAPGGRGVVARGAGGRGAAFGAGGAFPALSTNSVPGDSARGPGSSGAIAAKASLSSDSGSRLIGAALIGASSISLMSLLGSDIGGAAARSTPASSGTASIGSQSLMPSRHTIVSRSISWRSSAPPICSAVSSRSSSSEKLTTQSSSTCMSSSCGVPNVSGTVGVSSCVGRIAGELPILPARFGGASDFERYVPATSCASSTVMSPPQRLQRMVTMRPLTLRSYRSVGRAKRAPQLSQPIVKNIASRAYFQARRRQPFGHLLLIRAVSRGARRGRSPTT